MSADNGVYILGSTTGQPGVLEYRVAECQNVEDINYVPKGAYVDDGEVTWHMPTVWRKFHHSAVYTDEAIALRKAKEKYDEISVCEYGIKIISMPRPFPTARQVVDAAIVELGGIFNGVVNDDSAVRNRQLYQIRFALMDVLHLLSENIK